MMSSTPVQGRVNQKRRTRTAIVAGCRTLIESGSPTTMAAVARAAEVSEATAYRYFPDLVSVIREALVGLGSPAEFGSIEHSEDPVERVAHATEVLARYVLAREGAVRALASASLTRSDAAAIRPGYRFGLIDRALAPLTADSADQVETPGLRQLRLDLAVILGAEALFTLMDACGLSSDEAVASVVHTARVVTEAAVRRERTG